MSGMLVSNNTQGMLEHDRASTLIELIASNGFESNADELPGFIEHVGPQVSAPIVFYSSTSAA